jgi:hypothetical protein
MRRPSALAGVTLDDGPRESPNDVPADVSGRAADSRVCTMSFRSRAHVVSSTSRGHSPRIR